MINKALPANLAFVAVIGHGLLDRYPNLRISFLEFGADWFLHVRQAKALRCPQPAPHAQRAFSKTTLTTTLSWAGFSSRQVAEQSSKF